jgi:hypothetical protein
MSDNRFNERVSKAVKGGYFIHVPAPGTLTSGVSSQLQLTGAKTRWNSADETKRSFVYQLDFHVAGPWEAVEAWIDSVDLGQDPEAVKENILSADNYTSEDVIVHPVAFETKKGPVKMSAAECFRLMTQKTAESAEVADVANLMELIHMIHPGRAAAGERVVARASPKKEMTSAEKRKALIALIETAAAEGDHMRNITDYNIKKGTGAVRAKGGLGSRSEMRVVDAEDSQLKYLVFSSKHPLDKPADALELLKGWSREKAMATLEKALKRTVSPARVGVARVGASPARPSPARPAGRPVAAAAAAARARSASPRSATSGRRGSNASTASHVSGRASPAAGARASPVRRPGVAPIRPGAGGAKRPMANLGRKP